MVVFGATGVTGRQVAAHLAVRAPEGARWAAAGRDAARVTSTLADCGAQAPETLVADVSDPASLRSMVARTRVVLDLVGPYTLYGRPVIEACIAGGAHYVDLTGEIPFVRQVIDELGGAAEAAGVKIVQVCGFEALPADMAVLLAREAARDRFDQELASADLLFTVLETPPGMPRLSDSVSGGTLQSVAAIAGHEDAAVAIDPAALVEDPATAAAIRAASPFTLAPRRAPGGAVIAPMMPAAFINPAVIQRTGVLLAQARGGAPAPIRYREGIALGGGAATLPLRYLAAGALAGSQALLSSLARAPRPVRGRVGSALGAALPGSGFGPRAERLEGWRWSMTLDARTTGGQELRVLVEGDGHPGYLATARMLGEAGLLLAREGATSAMRGCLTPAAALGAASAPSFSRAGLRFSVA